MMKPGTALFSAAHQDPLILVACSFCALFSFILIWVRAVRIFFSEKKGGRFHLLRRPDVFALLCMVYHFLGGLYNIEYYSYICLNTDGLVPGVFYFLPNAFVFSLGETWNFLFMWIRASHVDYQSFRSRSYKRMMKIYASACFLFLIFNLILVVIHFFLTDESFSQTCDGKWIYVPLPTSGDHEDNVGTLLRNLTAALVGLFTLMEVVATFTGVYLFWKPFRMLQYRQAIIIPTAELSHKSSRENNPGGAYFGFPVSMHGSVPPPSLPGVTKVQVNPISSVLQMENKEAQQQGDNTSSSPSYGDDQLQSLVFWNLVPAFSTQVFYLCSLMVILYVSATSGRVHFQSLVVSHSFTVFVFVAYYTMVFRDHLWVMRKLNSDKKKRSTAGRTPAPV